MGKGRILIADDNRDILRLVEVNLKFENYETLAALNGEEALDLAREEHPDLILLDVMLPKLDGWQVLRHLKEDSRTQSIPVIIMTGTSLRDRRERDLVQGVADYLSKPFNPLRLLDMVAAQLQGRPRHEIVGEQNVARPPSLERTRVVVLHGDSGGRTLLQNLLGNPMVEIVAVVGQPEVAGPALARELHLPTVENIEVLDETLPVDFYLDTRDQTDAALHERAARQGAEVLSGRTLGFLHVLLAERDRSHLKERDLVRELKDRVEELSILNEMARLVSSPFEIPELYKRTLNLTLRIADLSGGSVLIYDERQERFVSMASVGLSEDFKTRARLPLSDPIVDEVLTLCHPLHVTEVDARHTSGLMGVAHREGLASLMCLPLVVKDKVIGLLVVGTRHRHVFRNEEKMLLTGLSTQMSMVIENAQLHHASQQKQAFIEQLLGKIIQTQEDERKHLAAEMHDSIAQSLAGMLTQIQICQSLLSSGATEEVEEQLASIRTIIAGSVKEVRQIIFNLRPSSLDDLGLIPSIENYIKRFEREEKLTVHLVVDDMPSQRLPSTLETTIFRIVQESLTNIKKHANARNVWIRLNTDGLQVSLKIVDDGQGFVSSEVTDKFFRGRSHGVEGMKERAALLGGTFQMQSQEGAGTVVRVCIPVPRHVGGALSALAPGAFSAAAGPDPDRSVVLPQGRGTLSSPDIHAGASLVVESSALAAVGYTLARLGEQALGDRRNGEDRGDPGPRTEAQASRKERVGKPSLQD